MALHSTGKSSAAIAKLKAALVAHPSNREILEALASFYGASGESAEAEKYGARLRELKDG